MESIEAIIGIDLTPSSSREEGIGGY